MMKTKFVTAVTCIDGRIYLPLIKWIQKKYDCQYVDLITEPGVVKSIINGNGINQSFIDNIEVSRKKHQTTVLLIAAHHDCAGNPVSDKTQKTQLAEAVSILKPLFPSMKVEAIWQDRSFKPFLL